MQTMTIALAEGQYSRTTVEWRIAEFVRVLNAHVLLSNAQGDYQSDVTYYVDKPGPKFTRVVRDWSGQRSVECFVENATGFVVKSAGWKSPAKDKSGFAYRYNLMDEASRLRLYSSIRGSLGSTYYITKETKADLSLTGCTGALLDSGDISHDAETCPVHEAE